MKVFKRENPGLRISRAEALKSRPVKNSRVVETRLETGEMLLEYPLAVRPWMAAIIRSLGRPAGNAHTRKLQLDTLGTSVWELLNGKRSVEEIIAKFADIHRIPPREAEIAVTRFLRDLGRRELIGLK